MRKSIAETAAAKVESVVLNYLEKYGEVEEPLCSALDDAGRLPQFPDGLNDDQAAPFYDARDHVAQPVVDRFVETVRRSDVIKSAVVTALLSDSIDVHQSSIRALAEEIFNLLSETAGNLWGVIASVNPHLESLGEKERLSRSREVQSKFLRSVKPSFIAAMELIIGSQIDLLRDVKAAGGWKEQVRSAFGRSAVVIEGADVLAFRLDAEYAGLPPGAVVTLTPPTDAAGIGLVLADAEGRRLATVRTMILPSAVVC